MGGDISTGWNVTTLLGAGTHHASDKVYHSLARVYTYIAQLQGPASSIIKAM